MFQAMNVQLGYDLNDNHNELVNYPMAMNYIPVVVRVHWPVLINHSCLAKHDVPTLLPQVTQKLFSGSNTHVQKTYRECAR